MTGVWPELNAQVRPQWESFIDRTSQYRQELFQVALRLTTNPFDAEDLVHDVLLRAFASGSVDFGRVQNERAYLHRMLSNLWIDRVRRARFEVATNVTEEWYEDESVEVAEGIRKAAYVVFGCLPPRERACLVLQEICGYRQNEIADMLSTTPGAVKVAVHRARNRLRREERSASIDREPLADPMLVNRFVEAMQSHDLHTLKSLVVDSLQAEVFPCGTGVGWKEHVKEGWIRGCFYHHIVWRETSESPVPLDLEVRMVDDEPIVLVFRRSENSERAVEEVWRFQEEDGLVVRVRDYCFSPDLVAHVARHFGLPFRKRAYRLIDQLYNGEA